VLRATDVSFSYGTRRVLRRVSLDVSDDGLVGIIGPNGSGKTTLLRMLSGTLRPESGRVLIDESDLADRSRAALARRMAVVPQESHLAFDYSVLEVVLMGRYPHLGPFEIEGPDDIAIARDALRSTGTAALEERQFSTLSGGEKQRVIIAAALAQISSGQAASPGSTFLLLDEPTAALDLAYQLEVAALLAEIRRQRPIGIVVSTHDLNFAAGLCHTLMLLKDGAVLAAGPTDEVLTRDNIRQLYGVEADVHRHADAGHVVVVPLRRAMR
jgi:ABC-type cobalamin/Fe3+-siderophores transport system ATPase subunit